MRRILAFILVCLLGSGCSAIPDIVHEPRYHNPFPQLSRVVVLPFYNQSAEPTVDGEQVALAYYNELQAIPGFEVVPVGVAKQMVQATGVEPRTSRDFQQLARAMGVDAVIIGSVTEFSPYYPPRMGLSVRWYAANPSFHPIPPGYGLPWGTADEEYIPESLVFEAEFALAKEQLKTQTPDWPGDVPVAEPIGGGEPARSEAPGTATELLPPDSTDAGRQQGLAHVPADSPRTATVWEGGPGALPADWPDPRGFVPAAPAPTRPSARPQDDPILSHTRLYHGQDAEFTRRLASYYYFRDDARFGGWPGYLQRSEDFVRFCCHTHITEMLAARGGAGETRVVWRWPIRRYER